MRTATYAILSAMVLVFAACGPAPEESAEAPPLEDAFEEVADAGIVSAEAEAVSQLNDMCPENWCMGDYQYEFAEIVCAGASCTLTFTAEGGGESHDGAVELDYDEPLIDEFGDLEPGYFERVTDALDEWEIAQAGADA